MSFERFDSGAGEAESVRTVNLLRQRRFGSRDRHQLAWMIAEDARRRVFEELVRLLEKRGYDCEVRDATTLRPNA